MLEESNSIKEVSCNVQEIGDGWMGFVYTFKIPAEEFTQEVINLFIPNIWNKFASYCAYNKIGSVSDLEIIIKKKDGYNTIGIKWHPMGVYAINCSESFLKSGEASICPIKQ
jgi:hypothetical protein